MRTFLRLMNLLEAPSDLFRSPLVMQRVLESYARRDEREKTVLGPTRGEMIDLFAQAL